MAVVMMCLPRLPMRSMAEKIAQLSASVPPAVKKTRVGSAPIALATCSRALRSFAAASPPRRYRALGFAQLSSNASTIAATASGQGFVVAELSK